MSWILSTSVTPNTFYKLTSCMRSPMCRILSTSITCVKQYCRVLKWVPLAWYEPPNAFIYLLQINILHEKPDVHVPGHIILQPQPRSHSPIQLSPGHIPPWFAKTAFI